MPAFTAPSYPAPSLLLLPAFIILGAVAGILGVGFNRGIVSVLDLSAKVTPKVKTLIIGVFGACVGLTGYFAPKLIGGGHILAEQALDGRLITTAIPLLLGARFLMTLGSYATGVPGGIFAPLLALGAMLGLFVGDIAGLVFPHSGVIPGAFAVVGMAAYFSSIVRAPLTGVVLIVEMTSSYALSVPLLVACFTAYSVAEATKNLPIYETLLERDLKNGGTHVAGRRETTVIELDVEPGSPFEGLAVRDLGLPAGILLVNCRDERGETLPTASTRLEAHMKITAVISENVDGGLLLLKAGVENSSHV